MATELTERVMQRLFEAIERGENVEALLHALQGPLAAAGDLGNTAAEGIGMMAKAVTPEPVERMVEQATSAVMGSAPVQAALTEAKGLMDRTGVTGYLNENPQVGDMLSAAGGASVVAPAGKMGQLINRSAANLPTKLEGFYGERGPLAILDYTPGAIKGAVKEAFSPQARANARTKGTGQVRVDEFAEAPRNDAIGNAMASYFMRDQTYGDGSETLAGNMPTVKGEILGEAAPGSDELVDLMMAQGAPREIAEAHARRGVKALSGPMSKKEMAIRGLLEPGQLVNPKHDQAKVVVRDKAAPESKLGLEAAGADIKTSPPAVKWLGRKAGENYADKVMGKPMSDFSTEDWTDYLNYANAYNRGNWIRRPDVFKDSTPGEVHDLYTAAMASAKKGRKLGSKQMAAIDYVEANKGGANVNILPDGRIEYRTGSVSSAQDLGGIGNVFTIDPKTMEVYGNVIDGHDLVGANPVRGTPLYNMTPVEARPIEGKLADPGRKTAAVEAREAAAEKWITEKTGMPREKGESLFEWQRRVMKDYNAPVGMQDKLGALFNGLLVANTAAQPVMAE